MFQPMHPAAMQHHAMMTAAPQMMMATHPQQPGVYYMQQPQPQPQPQQLVYQQAINPATGQVQWMVSAAPQPQPQPAGPSYMMVPQGPAAQGGYMYVTHQAPPQQPSYMPQPTYWAPQAVAAAPPPPPPPYPNTGSQPRPQQQVRTNTLSGSMSSYSAPRSKPLDPATAASSAAANSRNKKQFLSNHPFDETDEFQACEDAPENRSRFTAATLPPKAVYRLRPARPPAADVTRLPPFDIALPRSQAEERAAVVDEDVLQFRATQDPVAESGVVPARSAAHSWAFPSDNKSDTESTNQTLFGFGPVGGSTSTTTTNGVF